MISNNTQSAIEAAIQTTYETSKQITTPNHIAYLIAELASNMQALPSDGIIDHLANTFGNSSHLVVYPGESLSRRIVHERAIPSAANCRVRRP